MTESTGQVCVMGRELTQLHCLLHDREEQIPLCGNPAPHAYMFELIGREGTRMMAAYVCDQHQVELRKVGLLDPPQELP
jgi:hypothetical protein